MSLDLLLLRFIAPVISALVDGSMLADLPFAYGDTGPYSERKSWCITGFLSIIEKMRFGKLCTAYKKNKKLHVLEA